MVMPEYRWIGVDLLTRQVIEDLPLYGTSFQRRISGPGNMTGSFKLGTGLFSDPDLLSASEPGLRALFAIRNRQCIWAGPIWSRTYQSQANVCSLTGQSYESIFSAIKILSLIDNRTDDQTLQLKFLIDLMQAQPSCNFGIDTSRITASGVQQTMTVQQYEHKLFIEPIADLLKAANSFDYIIDYAIGQNDNISVFAKTGYPVLGYSQDGITVDYPGQVSNYYWPDSAARGIVRETVMGKGEGTKMPVATYTNEDLVAAGYPMWEEVRGEKSIEDPTQLARIAEESGRTKKMPVQIPTIELAVSEGEDGIDFSEWSNLGAPITLNIDEGDPRFPAGKTFTSRLLGWDYTPASSESPEGLKLILEGQG
jgi:hypothetical protein